MEMADHWVAGKSSRRTTEDFGCGGGVGESSGSIGFRYATLAFCKGNPNRGHAGFRTAFQTCRGAARLNVAASVEKTVRSAAYIFPPCSIFSLNPPATGPCFAVPVTRA